MKKIAVGIDIGGTNTVIGFVDKDGKCLAETGLSTTKHEEVQPFLAEVKTLIDKTISELGDVELVGIGVGAPNGNFHKGTIEFAPNLKWKGMINFVDEFKKFYNLPIFLTNDANAAAMGELIYGAAKGLKDIVVITLGTGLGSGIIVNGDLVYGHDGFAGEVGHTTVFIDGRQCGCGKKGCLETYVSATGIVRSMAEILCNSNKPSKLRDVPYNELNAYMIELAATKDGDELAKQCYEYTGKILGIKLADVVAHTSPSTIFLFGGVAKAGNLIIEPTKRYMEEYLLPVFKNKIEIKQSGLLNENAAVLGASALVWNELNK